MAGWFPAEMASGLPILPRYPLSRTREDLVFRALLGQPLILYGHHWDLAEGLETFAQVANDVNRLGDVRWGPLDTIAKCNYSARRAGKVLVVQMYSRRAIVEVPENISSLVIKTPGTYGERLWQHLVYGTNQAPMQRVDAGWVSDVLQVAGGVRLELHYVSKHILDPDRLPRPPARGWPILRRLLVEGRDRAYPLATKWRRDRI
jgi:hypothetical protein